MTGAGRAALRLPHRPPPLGNIAHQNAGWARMRTPAARGPGAGPTCRIMRSCFSWIRLCRSTRRTSGSSPSPPALTWGGRRAWQAAAAVWEQWGGGQLRAALSRPAGCWAGRGHAGLQPAKGCAVSAPAHPVARSQTSLAAGPHLPCIICTAAASLHSCCHRSLALALPTHICILVELPKACSVNRRQFAAKVDHRVEARGRPAAGGCCGGCGRPRSGRCTCRAARPTAGC